MKKIIELSENKYAVLEVYRRFISSAVEAISKDRPDKNEKDWEAFAKMVTLHDNPSLYSVVTNPIRIIAHSYTAESITLSANDLAKILYERSLLTKEVSNEPMTLYEYYYDE